MRIVQMSWPETRSQGFPVLEDIPLRRAKRREVGGPKS